MATKATPRWLKHLRIGVIAGILLGITGLIADASWLTWGFLYAPALSLTNKPFWAVVWKMLGAKDEHHEEDFEETSLEKKIRKDEEYYNSSTYRSLTDQH